MVNEVINSRQGDGASMGGGGRSDFGNGMRYVLHFLNYFMHLFYLQWRRRWFTIHGRAI
jgi:hypothetical protein